MGHSCHSRYNCDGTSYIYCLFYCRTTGSYFNFITNPCLELLCFNFSERISQYLLEDKLFTAQKASRRKTKKRSKLRPAYKEKYITHYTGILTLKNLN